MIRSTKICGLAIALALITSSSAWAQDEPEPDEDIPVAQEVDEDEPIDDQDDQDDDVVEEDEEEAPEAVDDENDEETPEAEEAPQLPDEAPPLEAEEPVEPGEEMQQPADDDEWDDDDWDDDDWDDGFDDEDIDFVPLDELDDTMLDRITPLSRFPFVEYEGQLRTRSRLRYNFDLDTAGTSAVLAPIETQVPADQPANEDADALWTTDLRFRVAPTFHLTESLRLQTDFDFLRNVAFGADPRHSYFVPGQPAADRQLMDSSASTASPIHVREAYGELDAFFGTIRAGRMLDHWGLGMTANDGNCADCDWGSQVDRLALQTRAFGVWARATYDISDAGLAPNQPGFDQGNPYQLGRLDTAHQWTVSLFQTPMTREEREQQAHQLNEESPVINGGLYFRSRRQTGEFVDDDSQSVDIDAPSDPIYRGLNLYSGSPWVQFLFHPEPDHSIRIELEGLATLGTIDNVSNQRVGFTQEEEDITPDVNCFDSDARDDAPQACQTDADGESTDEFVFQYGLALESELNFGGPVSFGLNGGFASGGDEPNWGYRSDAGAQLDFTRFSPDYHVDLILFREVIGTVTNAYYANPYANIKFFENHHQHFEFQLDGIASRAFNSAGTPGDSPWLGIELNNSLRYVVTDTFLGAIDAGILFPLGGMGAVEGRERLNHYGALGPYAQDIDPSLAWTVQGRLNWNF